jgi:WD40 repeat protein
MVTACAWSADGARVVSASGDSTFKIWDANTGECLWTGAHLPEGADAAWDRERFLWASAEDWRWIGFEAAGLTLLPCEAKGPVPGLPQAE